MKKACGYIRVSTLRQADSGLGLEAQRDAIERYFEFKLKPDGYVWGGFFDDPAVSGNKPLFKRPAGSELNKLLERGDAFVVSKLDRGFRNTLDILETYVVWQKRGIALHALDVGMDTSTAVGELCMTMIGAISRFERRRMSERQCDCNDVKRKLCLAGAGRSPPWGFRFSGKGPSRRLLRDLYLREVGKQILAMRRTGCHSWHRMMAIMNSTRALNRLPDGQMIPWTYTSIRRACFCEQKLQELEEKHGPENIFRYAYNKSREPNERSQC